MSSAQLPDSSCEVGGQLLVDGELAVGTGGGRASALRALARQLSSRARSGDPDGLDRLRLLMLAASGDPG